MVGTEKKPKAPPQGRIVVKKIRMAKANSRKNRAAKISTGVAKKVTTSTKISKTSATKVSCGLPSFRLTATSPNPRNRQDSVDNSFEEDNLPSDTLMAIQSLIRSDRGLHVPITNNGSVQVILESQVYSIFDENHASATNTELLKLIETNKIKRMCCHDMSSMALMLTEDYVQAVWDAHHHNINRLEKQKGDEIVTWFLAQLHNWTKASISEPCIVEQWEENAQDTDTITGEEVLRYLLNAQFLLRKVSGDYVLWLPHWGTVLKTWNEARKQLLTLLAQRKEMSKANVLQKNRHSLISTAFLMDELLSQEKIRVVERPFGSFLQLVREP